jgi:lipoprotein-anchoring transpeptidase ErfK/SrfK
VELKGSYETVNPDDVINASISPTDGDTVGIGAPIMIALGTDIDDTTGRQNIEKAITVTTVPKTAGSFAWIQHDDGWGLDWRPKSYWAPGTKVKVAANLYGVSYGNNLWGKEDITSSFTIGRSEITKGNIATHRLKVYRDGKLLFDFPTSFGLESDPGRVTRGGTYIVMSKEYLHLMSNPAYHYKNFKAYYAVRISNSGVFIHANDGTADVQGYENVTHGCANLTMSNAQAFYDQTMYGDPVEITNSSIPMSQSEGDVYDWSIPWSQWQTMSALSKAYAG